jgi:hypothetical protein
MTWKDLTMKTLIALFLLVAAPAAAQHNHLALVQETKATLVARGQAFATNCDAFQITARVAWALRAEGAVLIKKSAAQNGCVYLGQKYSHDALQFSDGWADLLASAGPPANVNTPTWQWTAGATNTADATKYAPPVDLDAGTAPPVVTPPVIPPVDPPLPPQIVTELLAKVFLELQALRLNQEALMEALGTVRAAQTDSWLSHAHGLQGDIFGYPIVLKPVP